MGPLAFSKGAVSKSRTPVFGSSCKSRNKVSVGEPAEGSLPWHSVNRADPCTVSLEGAGERPTCVYRVHPLSEADLRVFLPRAGVGLSLLLWRERPLKSGPRLFEAGRADLSRAPFFPPNFGGLVFLLAI